MNTSMKLPFQQEYIADAICRAVNLPGFVEPAWSEREHPTLRILLTPSFHPEVCITISRAGNSCSISVMVLGGRFWVVGPTAGLKSSREQISASTETYEGWLNLFKKACAQAAVKGRVVCIDGMSMECCLVSRQDNQRFKTCVDPRDHAFLKAILEVAWANCKDPKVRNGLSDAAYYLDLKFPHQEIPPDLPTSQIAILGTPEARKEYFELLQKVKGTKQ